MTYAYSVSAWLPQYVARFYRPDATLMLSWRRREPHPKKLDPNITSNLNSETDPGLRSATPMLTQRQQDTCTRRAALKFSIGGRESIRQYFVVRGGRCLRPAIWISTNEVANDWHANISDQIIAEVPGTDILPCLKFGFIKRVHLLRVSSSLGWKMINNVEHRHNESMNKKLTRK